MNEDLLLKRLDFKFHWSNPPFEGIIRIRFSCKKCNSETVEFEEEPISFQDLVSAQMYCYECDENCEYQIKFIEAGNDREPIKVVDAINIEEITRFLKKLRIFEELNEEKILSTFQISPELLEKIQFTRVVYPNNFKKLIFEKDFLFIKPSTVEECILILNEQVLPKLKTSINWTISVPSRDPTLLLPFIRKQFLAASTDKLRGNVKILFEGEEGIDQGGLTREFFMIVSEAFMNPQVGLFTPAGPNGTFHISPTSAIVENHLDYFKFIGRFLAKALLDQLQVKLNWNLCLFHLLLCRQINFFDIKYVDANISRNYLKLLSLQNQGSIEDLCLNFVATIDDFGKIMHYELKPNGSQIEVTLDNLAEYIQLLSSWRIFDSVLPQLNALINGFSDVIPPQCLGFLDRGMLNLMLCGLPKIDPKEWIAYIVFEQSGDIDTNILEERKHWFKEFLLNANDEMRAKLLQFSTGCSTVVSFRFLEPPFTVEISDALETDCLAQAHTCFNQLVIPVYSSKLIFYKQLEKSLEFSMGFGEM